MREMIWLWDCSLIFFTIVLFDIYTLYCTTLSHPGYIFQFSRLSGALKLLWDCLSCDYSLHYMDPAHSIDFTARKENTWIPAAHSPLYANSLASSVFLVGCFFFCLLFWPSRKTFLASEESQNKPETNKQKEQISISLVLYLTIESTLITSHHWVSTAFFYT